MPLASPFVNSLKALTCLALESAPEALAAESAGVYEVYEHSSVNGEVIMQVNIKPSQELLPKYTEQERQLTCPEGVCVRAVFQQPELRGMSARARPRVTLRMVLVLFTELFFCFGSKEFLRRPCLRSSARILLRPALPFPTPGSP